MLKMVKGIKIFTCKFFELKNLGQYYVHARELSLLMTSGERGWLGPVVTYRGELLLH